MKWVAAFRRYSPALTAALLFVGSGHVAPRARQPAEGGDRLFLPVALRSSQPGIQPTLAPKPSPTGTSGAPRPTPGTATPRAPEDFTYLTNTDAVHKLAVDPLTGHVWAVGWGGAAEWDTQTGAAEVYTLAQGLPSHKLSAVTVAPDGTVWVGTRGDGVASRVPGAAFRPLSLGSGPWDNDVLAVDQDPDGTLWFGTSAGAVRLAPDGTAVSFSRDRGEVGGSVTATARDAAGNRWFGIYGGGLSQLTPQGQWRTIHPEDGAGLSPGSVLQLVTDDQGRVWVLSFDYVTTPDGLRAQPAVDIIAGDGTWSHLDVTDWVYDGALRDVAFDSAGRAWFASDEGLFVPNPDGRWRREGTAAGLPTDQALDLAFGADEVLWVATSKGLARRDPSGAWHTLLRGALPGTPVNGLAVDSEGTAWLGTTGGGLARLTPDGTWRVYGSADGLTGPSVGDVAVDDAGGVWFANWGQAQAEDGGAFYLDPDGSLQRYTMADGLRSASVIDIAVAPGGDVWFAMGTYFYEPGRRRDGGVSVRRADASWRSFGREDGLPAGGDVRALAVAGDGTVWAGSAVVAGAPVENLARLSVGGVWEQVALPASPVSDDVYALAADAAGNLWVGTWGGVFLRDPAGVWTTPEDDGALAFQAAAIVAAGDGAVWFGASGGARVRRPDGSWGAITEADGLGMTSVEEIALGPDGRVWMAGREGVVTILTP